MIRTHFNLAVLLVLLLTTLPVWAQSGVEGQMAEVKGKVSLVRGQAASALLHKHDTVQQSVAEVVFVSAPPVG